MSMSKYIVYGLTDPRSGLIRYVGKSAKGLRRPRDQVHHAPRENNYKAKWIRQLLRLGLDYGIAILEVCITPEELSEAEKKWIAKLRNDGLPLTNLTDGGEGMCGHHPSPEHLKKMSETTKRQMSDPANREHLRQLNLGKKHSPEARAKMSEAQKRRSPPSSATRAKLSKASKGRKRSKETLARMSAAATGKVGGFKGKTHTVETKEKLRCANLGKKASAETRKKLSIASRGRKHSPEARKKMSASQTGNQNTLGRRHRPESIKKMSEARRRHWANPENKKRLSASMKGRQLSQETRARMSESQLRRRERERKNAAA